jgi:hypothetical protein
VKCILLATAGGQIIFVPSRWMPTLRVSVSLLEPRFRPWVSK